MTELPVSPELFALVSEAVAYGLHIAEGKETLQPAMVTESASGRRTLTQVVLLQSDDVFSDARQLLNQVDDVRRAALVVDGTVNVSGGPEDAFIVHVGERGAPGYQFMQRYRRKRFGNRVATIGNLGYAGERTSLFD